MRRRQILRAAAATLAAALPSRVYIARAAAARAMRFVPDSDLSVLDPIWTTTQSTNSHGYYVFDTLYGLDAAQNPHPQMAEGHSISPDGRVWTIRLRDHLQFHDGEPVRARDCTASLQRWAARDVFGQILAAVVDDWGAPDDRTLRIALKSPFPLLAHALAKPNGVTPFIMPERLARTDPNKQVTEMVGSGPYRFLKDEFVAGSRAAYQKFTGYVPRAEPPEWTSGGKVAHIERVEWQVIPDPATATAALQGGEIDWLANVQPDLAPLLRQRHDIAVAPASPAGQFGVLRFNHLLPPFDDVRIRRAVMRGLHQDDYMRTVTAGDAEAYRGCKAFFPCGTPYGRELDPAAMDGDVAAARAAIKDAGYAGQRIVILNTADVPGVADWGPITLDYFRRLGLDAEIQDVDRGTLVKRRISTQPVDKGGWSVFLAWTSGSIMINPAASTVIRGVGAKGWAGSYTNARIEALTTAWVAAGSDSERDALADAIQREALADVPFVPLGLFYIQTAWRRQLQGMVAGSSPYPWGLSWAEA